MYINTLLQFAYFVVPLLTADFMYMTCKGSSIVSVLELIMHLEYVNMHTLPVQDVGG